MNEWLVVALAGIGSYVLRISMIATDRLQLPPRLESSADLVAPTAFTALALSSLASTVVSASTVVAAAPVLVAATVALALAARTGRAYLSLLGLPSYWLMAVLFT